MRNIHDFAKAFILKDIKDDDFLKGLAQFLISEGFSKQEILAYQADLLSPTNDNERLCLALSYTAKIIDEFLSQ